MFLVMAQKDAGKSDLFVQPSLKTRCRFHGSQHTETSSD